MSDSFVTETLRRLDLAKLAELEDALEAHSAQVKLSAYETDGQIHHELGLLDAIGDIKNRLALCLTLRCRNTSRLSFCEEHE